VKCLEDLSFSTVGVFNEGSLNCDNALRLCSLELDNPKSQSLLLCCADSPITSEVSKSAMFG
jgi:hypothetical protein